MQKIIDTHSHLYSSKFDRDLDEVIGRSKEVLSAIYLPNIDMESVEPMHQLTEKDPDFFFPMMGLHPCSVNLDFERVLEQMEGLLNTHTYYGIGETGIDLYWDKTYFEQQKEALQVQIEWAKERDLPIILHCRNSLDHVIEQISQSHDSRLRGIFHCFDGTAEQAAQISELGTFKLGIGGIITYRKEVQKMLKTVDLKYIVLETDSPYLPPEPHRKDKPRRNESSYTKYVAAKVGELYGVEYDEVAFRTNENVKEIFSER